MKHKHIYLLLIAILISQNLLAQSGSTARSSTFDNRKSQASGEELKKGSPGTSVYAFLDMAKKYLAEEKFAEAKEALKTAIRIDPMNLEAWALYDEAVISDYIATKRKEKLTPVITRDIQPLFSITRIDSYKERNTLYVVGSLKNLSKNLKRKIQLTARILDKNNKELRKEIGDLRLTERGLFPNESSLFEIPFKNPPQQGKFYRVEVSGYE